MVFLISRPEKPTCNLKLQTQMILLDTQGEKKKKKEKKIP